MLFYIQVPETGTYLWGPLLADGKSEDYLDRDITIIKTFQR